MTVFKAFLKVLNKYKLTVIINTVILVFFGAFNFKNNDTTKIFQSSKPDIVIVNNDEEVGITKSLITYLEDNSNIVQLKNSITMDDALFYRDTNYIIIIPQGFRESFLAGKNPQLEIKTTGDYQASLANMMLERFMKTALVYQNHGFNEEEIISSLNKTLANSTEVKITSSIDTNTLDRAATYFNFASYTLLSGSIQIICLVLAVFREKNIAKRTVVSGLEYKKYNRKLLLSNTLFSMLLWIFYVILGFILLGKVMFTIHGLIYIINSFIFTIFCTVLAFFIGNLVTNKNAISGIVNCVALGSAFLCGAFVPQTFLPASVLKMAHVIPTYWFISSNNAIVDLEKITFSSLKPILINTIVIFGFIILFVVVTNLVAKKKRRSQ